MTHLEVCVTGKSIVVDHHSLKGVAAYAARAMNADGELAPDLYAYRCTRGRHFHITRLAEWEGVANELIYPAAPEALQLWAISGQVPDVPLH